MLKTRNTIAEVIPSTIVFLVSSIGYLIIACSHVRDIACFQSSVVGPWSAICNQHSILQTLKDTLRRGRCSVVTGIAQKIPSIPQNDS
jgi:hypothetical protein